MSDTRKPKIAVIFYSTYGTNHVMAQDAAEAARAAGAEVRLLRIAETAPRDVVDSQDGWKAEAARQADLPVASPADIEWADGYIFSTPTRFGAASSQMRAFIDTLGGVWSQGGTVNKTITAMASAMNPHGGQEATILGLYTTFLHWGALIVAPGYTDEAFGKAGGNPYGTSVTAGQYGAEQKTAIAKQAARLVSVTKKIIA